MQTGDWTQIFQKELNDARQASLAGNLGRARVCARRAAGVAAREYLLYSGITPIPDSAYDRLQLLASLPSLTLDIQQIAQHLLLRVDEDFHLPADVDLIVEAQKLADIVSTGGLKETN